MKLRAPQTVMHIAPGESVIRWHRYVPTEYGVEQYITNQDGEYQLRAQVEDQHWQAFCESEPSAAAAQALDDKATAKATGTKASATRVKR